MEESRTIKDIWRETYIWSLWEICREANGCELHGVKMTQYLIKLHNSIGYKEPMEQSLSSSLS